VRVNGPEILRDIGFICLGYARTIFAHSVIEITRLDFTYYFHPTTCIDQVRGEILKKKCHVIILLLAPNRHEIATLFASLVLTLCLEETPASDLTF